MRKLLRANLSRLWHDRTFRLLSALTVFFGVFTISPLSRLFNTSFARRTTLSGTPASFATSIPKLSSAPPRTIRRRNVMSSPRFFTAILKFCTPGKRSSSSVSSW